MTFDQIRTDLTSREPDLRGRAMQALLALARKDEGVHQEALAIFMGAVEHEDSPWAVASAARGVALIAGEREGRRAWRRLLNHPRPEVAGAVASVVDAAMAPALLDVLEKRSERTVQIPALRALGRMRYAPAFDVLVRRLGDLPLRPHAIEALGDFGDKRAVVHLTPLLTDKSEAWRADNQGPMLRVRDIARTVIARFESAPLSSPSAPPLRPAARAQGPTRLQPKDSRLSLWSYVPLAAGLATPLWFGVVTYALLHATGSLKTIAADPRTLDLIVMGPAAIGLLVGVVALARGRMRSRTEVLGLVVGLVLCGVFAFSFGWKFLQIAEP